MEPFDNSAKTRESAVLSAALILCALSLQLLAINISEAADKDTSVKTEEAETAVVTDKHLDKTPPREPDGLTITRAMVTTVVWNAMTT